MSQTTTARNACDARLYLDNASGVLIDISGSTNNVKIGLTNDVGDFKAFSSQWRGRLTCGKDAKVSLVIIFSTAAAEAYQLLKGWWTGGGDRTFQVDIPEDAVGNDRYSGEFILNSLDLPLASDDAKPIAVTAELLPNGEVTITAIAT